MVNEVCTTDGCCEGDNVGANDGVGVSYVDEIGGTNEVDEEGGMVYIGMRVVAGTDVGFNVLRGLGPSVGEKVPWIVDSEEVDDVVGVGVTIAGTSAVGSKVIPGVEFVPVVGGTVGTAVDSLLGSMVGATPGVMLGVAVRAMVGGVV